MALVPARATLVQAVFSTRALLVAAGLLVASACQNEAAPSVRSEPPRESAAAAPAVAIAAPAAGSVATPSTAGTPPGAAPAASAPSAAGSVASPTAVAARAAAPGAAASGAVGLAKYEPAAAPAADAPAKPASGQPIQGAAISEEPFSIWLQSVSPIAAGTAATVEAVLVAKPPYHCNADYPHKFKLAAAPAGLAYPETTVKGAKVTAEKSVLPISVQAQSPGKAKVSGTLSFSVCNEERCLVEKRELALELEVK
jgi:hypothetical protein